MVLNDRKLKVFIENFAGDLRHGEDWVQKMAHDYGYIMDTVGADGDEMDCFVGPSDDFDKIYIVEQVNEEGEFDEHKIMLGFSNIAEAKDAYHANYPEGWEGLKNISEIKAQDFWRWYEGLSKQNDVPITKVDEDARGLLVKDAEALAGTPDFSSRNEKENSMKTIENEQYRFDGATSVEKISKGQHTYGSKVDNSVCECPECYGGGRLGLFACKNCKGSGVINNGLTKSKYCPTCKETTDVDEKQDGTQTCSECGKEYKS